MSKQYIKFDDEAFLDEGLPPGVTHEIGGTMLFSVAEDAELPTGARAAEAAEYEPAKSAAATKLKAASIKKAKYAGLEYEGILVPFTSEAALAFLQVEGAFKKMETAGLAAEKIRSNIMFDDTGSVLPVSLEGGEIDISAEGDEPKLVLHHKFADVALWFTVKRNSFYQ